MEKKSIKLNYIYNLCYQVLLLIAPLITTPYISRVLGADAIGKASYVDSVAAYFVLFATMGITTYGQREISYVLNLKTDRSVVFWNIKILEFISASIVFVVYLIFANYQADKGLYLIFGFNILSVFFDVTWFFQGIEEFGKIAFRNSLFKVISIIYIFSFVKSKGDLWMYVFGNCFFTLLGNISLWVYLPQYIEKVDLKKLNPIKDIFTVLSLFVPTIAIQVYTVLDKTMIGIITRNSFENGYYEQALKISRMTLMIVAAMGTVMVSRIGYYFEQKQYDVIRKLIYRGYRFVWFLGVPLCLGLVVTAPNFVPWFFGEGYDKVVVLLRISAFLILAIGINNVTGVQYLIPTKKQNIFTLTVIIGAVTNLTLNFFLIPTFQSMGAIIASVLSETIIAVVQLIIIRKEIEPLYVLKQGLNYFVAGTIMFGVLYCLEKQLFPSVLHTLVLIFVGGSVYSIVLLIIKDEFLITYVRKVISKIKR